MLRSALSKVLVGAGGAALVATAFHAAPAVASAPAVAQGPVAGYAATAERDAAKDGKDLFRGVHFFQGEVAEELLADGVVSATPKVLKSSKTEEAAATVDGLIATIEEDDPAFFAEFSADLRSGDPYRVEGALTRGSEQIQKSFSVVDDGSAEGQCLAVALVVVGFVALVYSIHTAVVLDVHVMAEHIQIMGGELTTEQLVAKLTPALAR